MSVLERTATVTIRLEANCLDAGCGELAHRMHAQLGVPKYSRGASVMAVPESVEAWRAVHRTARKRADRAARLGYHFAEIDRAQYGPDFFAINTSLPVRQGRPMSEGYTTPHNHGPLPHYPCQRHAVFTFGILEDDVLVAYLTVYRVGQLVLISMILGHGAHLDAGIMFQLFQGLVAHQAGQGGTFFYNRHDSGQEGLRWMKERLGFRAADLEWVL